MGPEFEADQEAAAAAARAGVTVRTVDAVDELSSLGSLLDGVWGRSHDAPFLPTHLLKALAHSGNYVAAAFAGGQRLVGAIVGFLGDDRGRHLHSHIAGVDPSHQGRAVGYALKLHQRAWALARGLDRVSWTFDPLVRRNAYFNLAKLGARVVAYHERFYGALDDDINTGDESDRAVVDWVLTGPAAAPWTDGDGTVVLEADGTGHPVPHPDRVGDAAGPLRAFIPPDVVALRRADPAGARAWRLALRATFGRALVGGYEAVAMSRDGWYTLTRD